MLNLDTHILIYALTGDLTRRERRLLESRGWSISAITLWEIAKLAELGRIETDLEDRELGRILSAMHVWPITVEVCRAMLQLDFDSDPADELIAATSVAQRVPLLTRDQRMLRSKVVPLAR